MFPIKKATDLDTAFGGLTRDFMPPMNSIPKEFKSMMPNGNKWLQAQMDWFYHGFKNLTITPKPGVDTNAAIKHLQAIQASWEPAHEDKVAAVAFLMSEWFDDIKYELADANK